MCLMIKHPPSFPRLFKATTECGWHRVLLSYEKFFRIWLHKWEFDFLNNFFFWICSICAYICVFSTPVSDNFFQVFWDFDVDVHYNGLFFQGPHILKANFLSASHASPLTQSPFNSWFTHPIHVNITYPLSCASSPCAQSPRRMLRAITRHIFPILLSFSQLRKHRGWQSHVPKANTRVGDGI